MAEKIRACALQDLPIADRKAWRVNVEKVNRLLSTAGAQIRIDDQPAQDSKPVSATLPKNVSYSQFRQLMDDPNSDL